MKKSFIIILFLTLTFGLFAETGYNGLQWNIPRETLESRKVLQDIGNMEVEEKLILGTMTHVYYHVPADLLVSISYTIPREKTAQLLNKYGKKNQILKIQTYSLSLQEMEELVREAPETEEDEVNDSYLNETYFNLVYVTQQSGYDFIKGLEQKDNGIIYVYDYNDDTKVYIFENLIEGLTFVFYAYQDQDY